MKHIGNFVVTVLIATMLISFLKDLVLLVPLVVIGCGILYLAYDKTCIWIYKIFSKNSWAQFMLGLEYTKGKRVNKDQSKAVFWYEKAALRGNRSAQCNLGVILYENKNYEDAEYWYKKAALKGKGAAQLNLGVLYCYAKQDYSEGLFWYMAAAVQHGNNNIGGFAYNEIGNLFYNGNGVKQDFEKALFWYQKAVQQNNEDAKYNLGRMYVIGKGVERNEEKAICWFSKILNVKEGYADKSNEITKKELAKLNKINVEEKEPEVQKVLGDMFFYGKGGVNKDYSLAKSFYEKASNDENVQKNLEIIRSKEK